MNELSEQLQVRPLQSDNLRCFACIAGIRWQVQMSSIAQLQAGAFVEQTRTRSEASEGGKCCLEQNCDVTSGIGLYGSGPLQGTRAKLVRRPLRRLTSRNYSRTSQTL